jgi:hypothetical protein
MEPSKKQAYKHKPWRSQVKWISQLLLVALLVVLASIIYLELAGEATNVSQQMIILKQERIALKEMIASHQSELARYQSVQALKPKMEAMGFKRYTYEDVVYVIVPGYQAKEDFKLAPSSSEQTFVQPLMRSAYTQSLWDWLGNNIASISFLQELRHEQ